MHRLSWNTHTTQTADTQDTAVGNFLFCPSASRLLEPLYSAKYVRRSRASISTKYARHVGTPVATVVLHKCISWLRNLLVRSCKYNSSNNQTTTAEVREVHPKQSTSRTAVLGTCGDPKIDTNLA